MAGTAPPRGVSEEVPGLEWTLGPWLLSRPTLPVSLPCPFLLRSPLPKVHLRSVLCSQALGPGGGAGWHRPLGCLPGQARPSVSLWGMSLLRSPHTVRARVVYTRDPAFLTPLPCSRSAGTSQDRAAALPSGWKVRGPGASCCGLTSTAGTAGQRQEIPTPWRPGPDSPQTSRCNALGPSLDRQCQFRPLRHGATPDVTLTPFTQNLAGPQPPQHHVLATRVSMQGPRGGSGEAGGAQRSATAAGTPSSTKLPCTESPQLAAHTGQKRHTDGEGL